jgi:hypothetical protein
MEKFHQGVHGRTSFMNEVANHGVGAQNIDCGPPGSALEQACQLSLIQIQISGFVGAMGFLRIINGFAGNGPVTLP